MSLREKFYPFIRTEIRIKRRYCHTVEPRFNEVAGDRPNLFVKWRVHYIENLNIMNLRGNNQNVHYMEVMVNE